MSRISIVIGIMLGCTVIGGAVSAQTFTAYNLAQPVPGNQLFGATVGLDFTVNTSIIVNSLGAFDAAIPATHTAHALNGTIVTSIYNVTTQQLVPGLTESFSASSPGTLIGGYLYKDVNGINGIALAPGNYVVTWTTLNNNDQEGNSTVGGYTAPVTNNGGNLITIDTAHFRFNEQNATFTGVSAFPLNTTNGQLDAGTFTYTVNTPEPGTVSLFAGLMVAGGSAVLRRRRLRKKTA